MKYEALFKIKEILDYDIKKSEMIIEEIETLAKSLEKDKRNILSIVRNAKNINPESLRLIELIIKKNDLGIIFNKELYANKLGLFYMLDDESSKKEVEVLLFPIIDKINQKTNINEKNRPVWESDLNFKQYLIESLDNLINFEEKSNLRPVGKQLFESILNYILKIPTELLSEEDKLMAIYTINIANLEALQSQDKTVIQDESNIVEKPISKYKFEIDNESDFDDIKDLSSLYINMSSNLSQTDKNQIVSLLSVFNLNEINLDKIDKIKEYIENIGANFSADYFIKYVLLKSINDWYIYYENSFIEDDWLMIFDEIKKSIIKYQDYIELSMERTDGSNSVENNLIFLQKNGESFVGLDWMHKDNHDYESRDFADFNKGLDIIRDNSPVILVENTKKVKRAGIPGISENKFRRLKVGNFRIIFIDLIHFINEEYKEFFEGLPSCYLIVSFGKKKGEKDIYYSMETIGMTNLLKEYRIYINNCLKEVINMDISKEEKKTKVRELLSSMIKDNNELFNLTLNNDPDYAKLMEKNNTGGLNNA